MRNIIILTMLGFSIIFSACGAEAGSNGAAEAVEGYVNAIVSNDEAKLISLSCADWESNALIELDSFQLVTITLDDFACQQTGTDGEFALVDCQGKMLLSYNNEAQELDLSTRTYQVVEQGGDWLVCGVR